MFLICTEIAKKRGKCDAYGSRKGGPELGMPTSNRLVLLETVLSTAVGPRRNASPKLDT